MSVVSIGVLEDDLPQANLLKEWLIGAGFKVFVCNSGEDFLLQVSEGDPRLLIMDWQLPDCEGIDVLVSLRTTLNFTGSILFATARGSETDIVRGLNCGADDYLVKPLRRAELLARVSALLRRATDSDSEVWELGSVQFDLANKRVAVRGVDVALTPTEFQLAVCVCSNVGKLLSRQYLLSEVWGVNASIDTRTVDVHMSRIRKILRIGPDMGYCIKTVYRHGYRLEML